MGFHLLFFIGFVLGIGLPWAGLFFWEGILGILRGGTYYVVQGGPFLKKQQKNKDIFGISWGLFPCWRWEFGGEHGVLAVIIYLIGCLCHGFWG